MKKLFLLTLLCVFSINLFAQQQFSKHYYNRIEKFNSEEMINPNDVVFLGDSITEGGDWDEYFKGSLPDNVNIFNRGISGDITAGVINRLDQVLRGKPKKIFLMIGINDLGKDIHYKKVVENIDYIVKEIRFKSPMTKIYLQSVLPVNIDMVRSDVLKRKTHAINKTNRGIRKIAMKYNIIYLNIYEYVKAPNSLQLDPLFTYDGLHLNEKGYGIWVKAIKKYVK